MDSRPLGLGFGGISDLDLMAACSFFGVLLAMGSLGFVGYGFLMGAYGAPSCVSGFLSPTLTVLMSGFLAIWSFFCFRGRCFSLEALSLICIFLLPLSSSSLIDVGSFRV
jgi:hypothetical protein